MSYSVKVLIAVGIALAPILVITLFLQFLFCGILHLVIDSLGGTTIVAIAAFFGIIIAINWFCHHTYSPF